MRFLFITDTHCGANPDTDFQMSAMRQPEPGAWARAVAAVHAARPLDAIVHGGDVIHCGQAARLEPLLSALAALAPVLVAHGNHDKVESNLRVWEELQDPRIQQSDCCFEAPDRSCDLLVLTSHWLVDGVPSPSWRAGVFPIPVLPESAAILAPRNSPAAPERPAIVVHHHPPALLCLPDTISQVTSLARAGTPLDLEPLVRGFEAFASQLNDILDANPRVRLLMSGHFHLNLAMVPGGTLFRGGPRPQTKRVHLSAPATGETPHLAQLVEVTSRTLTVQAVPLDLGLGPDLTLNL